MKTATIEPTTVPTQSVNPIPDLVEPTEYVAPNPNLLHHEGYVYDLSTGEIISSPEPTIDEKEKVPQEFIERLLKRVGKLDIQIAVNEDANRDANVIVRAIENEYRQKMEADPEFMDAVAILNNSAALVGRYGKARDSLVKFYEPLFLRFAQQELGDGKERTWRNAFGCLPLRKQQAKVRGYATVDLSKLQELLPEAVKLSVLLKPITETFKADCGTWTKEEVQDLEAYMVGYTIEDFSAMTEDMVAQIFPGKNLAQIEGKRLQLELKKLGLDLEDQPDTVTVQSAFALGVKNGK